MEKNVMTLEIPCYMTDSSYRLRASSFMDLAQVMAMEGSESLGFGHDVLGREGKCWVLYRMQFRFLKPVMWKEKVTMRTWHRGLDGLVFLRDYELIGEDDAQSVIGTSSWIVFDKMTREFVRNGNLPTCISSEPQCSSSMFEAPPKKVNIPRGTYMILSCEHKVSYSDVDFVGHTNNAKYVAWAMDSLDAGFVSTHPVKEVTVNFNKESRLGDIVRIYTAEVQEEDSVIFYVEGVVEGRQSYVVRIEFWK